MTAAEDERVVGRVVRAHGLRGELVVESSTDHEDVRFAPGTVLRVRPPRRAPGDAQRSGQHADRGAGPSGSGLPPELTVRAARHHGGRLLVTVDEVGDRDAAEALRTVALVADALDDEADDPDEFGDHELEGCAVVLGDGTAVGTVRDVVHGAAGELLVIEGAEGAEGAEALVPFVAAIVVEVDRAARRIVLDPPEGLLDPPAS